MTSKPMPKPSVKSAKKTPKHLQRDEYDLDELSMTLNEALEDKQLRAFVIYRTDDELQGIVTKLDANTKLIHIRDNNRNIHKVHFLDILKVTSV